MSKNLISIVLLCCAGSATQASAQELTQKLFPSDPQNNSEFATSIAIEGDVAIVGATKQFENGITGAGAAYIYRNIGGIWSFEAKLVAAVRGDLDLFGSSVSIHGDVAIVGAPDWGFGAFSGTGRAWVYRHNAGTWTLEQELVPSNGTLYDSCGARVAVWGDTLAVSNSSADTVTIFDYSGGTWSETTTLSSPAAGGSFPSGLVMKNNTLVAGDSWQSVGGLLHAGGVHVFERIGGVWTHQQEITAPIPNDEEFFGDSVGFDQDVIVVGVPNDDFDFYVQAGKAHVYRKVGGTWQHEARLEPSLPRAYAGFGRIVAVSGNRIVTASSYDSVSHINSGGAAYAYEWDGNTWIGGDPFYPAVSASNPGFGMSAALGGDTAMVGNYEHALGVPYLGAATVWDLSSGFRLRINEVRPEADNFSTWSVRGGQANSTAWLAYSLSGHGSTLIAPLNVTLGLANPSQAGSSISLNNNGEGSWNLYIPVQAQGFTVWFQALQANSISNVLGTLVG